MNHKLIISLALSLFATNVHTAETHEPFTPPIECRNYTEDSLVLFAHGGNATYLTKWFSGSATGYSLHLRDFSETPKGIQVIPLGVVGKTLIPINNYGQLRSLNLYYAINRLRFKRDQYDPDGSIVPSILLGVIPARYLKAQRSFEEAAIFDCDRMQITQRFVITCMSTINKDLKNIIQTINAMYPRGKKIDPDHINFMSGDFPTEESETIREMIKEFNSTKPLSLHLEAQGAQIPLFIKTAVVFLALFYFQYSWK